MTNEETVTPLGGADPVHRRSERIQSLLDHAKYALEEQEGLGSVLQSLEDARNLHRQQADAEEGRTAGTSDPTVAERIRGFLEDAEPELAGYLLNGHKPDQMLYAALSDAEEMVTMFGCAMIGSSEHFGGPPSDKILSEWTFLVERKVLLAKALAEKVREGSRHE